jgi:hypothetical protein
MFKTLGKYMPPPAGAKSPLLWGTRGRLTEMFGPASISIRTEPRNFNFRYRSAEHFLEVFKTYYGPMLKAFAALDAVNQNSLRGRPVRSHRAYEQSHRRYHGRAERVSGGCHYEAMR